MLGLRPSRLSIWLSRRWRVIRRSNFSKPLRDLMLFWAWNNSITYYILYSCWCRHKKKQNMITLFKNENLHFSLPKTNVAGWEGWHLQLYPSGFYVALKLPGLWSRHFAWLSLSGWHCLPETLSIRTQPLSVIKRNFPLTTGSFNTTSEITFSDRPTCKDYCLQGRCNQTIQLCY